MNDEVKVEESVEGEVLFPKRPLPLIRNKIRRRGEFQKLKRQERKEKKIAKKKKKNNPDDDGPKKIPRTIENTRERDDTVISALDEEDNKEVLQDIVTSEYAPYFNKEYEPKVYITSVSRPTQKTIQFGKDLQKIIPNSWYCHRRCNRVNRLLTICKRKDFTDIIIINENLKKANSMMIIHLPDGPTVNFRLSSVRTIPELRHNPRNILDCRPEVILNNFTTRLGNRIASVLASLFHYDPQFRGRRAVTFHNQRDYIFFRHHTYEFKRDGTKVALREHGPRFTLKPLWLQEGIFNGQTAEYEWIIHGRRHEMETSRRKFFL